MTEEIEWSRDWPQTAGWYWFYGWPYGRSGQSPAELVMVKVVQIQVGHAYIADGHFIWRSDAIGRFTPAVVPTVYGVDIDP